MASPRIVYTRTYAEADQYRKATPKKEKVIQVENPKLASNAHAESGEIGASLKAPQGYRWKDDPKHPEWCKVLKADTGETVGAINRLARAGRETWQILTKRKRPSSEGHRFKEIGRSRSGAGEAAAKAVVLLIKS